MMGMIHLIKGKTIVQIAEAFKLTKGRVSQILNKEENRRLKQLMIDQIALRKANQIADTLREGNEINNRETTTDALDKLEELNDRMRKANQITDTEDG